MSSAAQAKTEAREAAWLRFVSPLIWMAIAVVVVLWLPLLALIYVATAWRDPGRYTVGRWFRRAAMASVWVNPLWKFRTSGGVLDRGPFVFVANHESYADIFLISHLPWEMKWLSKAENFRIPVVGWMMRLAGDIAVDRNSRRSRVDALDGMRDRLAKNVGVMVFPEGTRSPTSEMLPFRDGAFRVAVDAGVPVVPIVVAGTRHCMAKGSFVFRPAVAEARVLDPLSTAGMTVDDVPRLRDEVRTRIEAARSELRMELGIE